MKRGLNYSLIFDSCVVIKHLTIGSTQTNGKPNWRLYKARQRQRQKDAENIRKKDQRKRKSKERTKSRQITPTQGNESQAFPRRMAKKRALDSVRKNLPASPRKKVAVVAALVESPSTRKALEHMGRVRSPEDEEDTRIATAALNDMATALDATKNKRSNDARAAVNVGVSLVSGEVISNARLRTKIAKRLNINRGRVSKGFQHRTKILRGEKQCWTYTERRTRSDALSTEVRKLAHNFWGGPEVSRRTGNKKDTIRKRIAPKVYVQHEKQILEMTQTEAFLAF